LIDTIKDRLLKEAILNEGTAGRFKLAAGLVFKKRLLVVGVNSYKSHPIMLNGSYRADQIYLHAEADCLRKARRIYSQDIISNSSLYVVRVKKTPKGKYVLGCAKPCDGCMGLIESHNIQELYFT
jgi:tRNA(Arg) A34 adenosine deaminase TadA